MAKPIPFLWFDDDAEAAADFYISVFPNSREVRRLRNPGPAPGPAGAIMTIEIELDGQPVTLLNGGPEHPQTPAFSFSVPCETQSELDRYWDALGAGGKEIACGWLTDRFGLAWQIVPVNVAELVSHPAAMTAMLGMVKLDIAVLEAALRDDRGDGSTGSP